MKIFVLEDDPMRIIWFYNNFKSHELTFVQTSERDYDFTPPYDVVFLDHDLGGRQMTAHEDDGAKFAAKIGDQVGKAFVIVHSHNPDGAQRIKRVLIDFTPAVVVAPFGEPLFRTITSSLERVVGEGK